MSALAAAAQEFGPGLLVAALAAPLVVLAVVLSPKLRFAALAMAPLAPLPALAAAILAHRRRSVRGRTAGAYA